ncbi:hypothetical protein P154DRAFT_448366 [Amniculicola lignicola CBS 123094]|uniref:Zona occludens toxin N-terminal domain-containing protein n=1 Tax=Amniculicola lignicola CBS 123094 TaxID=1392246 RepID=A0A6A5VX39_9PLEO|nr:hypothetical protein P154DRAFT_448366 [Amniculicola lignicola CBS 123094]
MDLLLTDTTVSTTVEAAASTTSELDSEIRHAPLISEGILLKARKGTVPQYGLLGTYAPDGVEESRAKIFLNTNVPFSAFICGVQGSGKSHTTACILENALIPSPNLGRLENPVSAMIFSYGEFSSDGGGFSISEAAFLATSHPAFPGQCVKKITVLTSPSNKALGNLYRRLPNVTVIPFKLKSRSLDINTMLKLMAVNESGHTPLYLATVESILREMAAASEDGRFDYVVFKAKLKRCQFNAMQKNALDQRLALLESYLDPNDHSPEPTFEPGEVTIMDLSCPFTDANTACVMFKIGLQRYLQSKAYGKMIVLDEAHKYMLNVPGAKALTDYLLTIVRLQRHYGARVVISTQEPTVMSELIPLCSLKVIHRFSSPEWFAALRKHIPMSADDKDDTLLRIEQLKTGAALVYSSEAVLGKTDSGTLIKGTGRMLKVHVRKRVTSDGGQSIMSV